MKNIIICLKSYFPRVWYLEWSNMILKIKIRHRHAQNVIISVKRNQNETKKGEINKNK